MPTAINSVLESDPESVSFPLIFRSHIDNCQFSEWYPKYKRLSPLSEVIKGLPQEFIEYLLEDGIILPPDYIDEHETSSSNRDGGATRASELPAIDSDVTGYDDDEEPEDPSLRFRDLHLEIYEKIKTLGGAVFPKLNWSAPKDAAWMSTSNNLKCVTPSDIYLLLKSSSHITHDLCQPYSDTIEYSEAKSESERLKKESQNASKDNNDNEDNESDSDDEESVISESLLAKPTYELVLRKWFDLNPALEFRCFVKDRTLIAISQRDYLKYYTFLEELKDSLGYEIEEFFENYLQDSFPDENFCFDVYIPEPYDRVYLIDINPFAPSTDPLLFTWYELLYKLDPSSASSSSSDQNQPLYNTMAGMSISSSNSSNPQSSQPSLSSSPTNSINSTASASSIPIPSSSSSTTQRPMSSYNLSGSHKDQTSSSSKKPANDDIFEYEFRLVQKGENGGGAPDMLGGGMQYSENRVPKDIVDASMSGSGIAELAREWNSMLNRQDSNNNRD